MRSVKNLPLSNPKHRLFLAISEAKRYSPKGSALCFRKSTVLIVSGIIFTLALIACKTSLLISSTQSLPYRVFLLIKGTSTRKGDLVAIKGHPNAYFKGLNYTKQIAGVAGDRIERGSHFIAINGQKRFPLRARTTQGKPLTPLKTQLIPKGYVFVAGDHERSFDSRYEEFGLVEERYILGRVWSLF